MYFDFHGVLQKYISFLFLRDTTVANRKSRTTPDPALKPPRRPTQPNANANPSSFSSPRGRSSGSGGALAAAAAPSSLAPTNCLAAAAPAHCRHLTRTTARSTGGRPANRARTYPALAGVVPRHGTHSFARGHFSFALFTMCLLCLYSLLMFLIIITITIMYIYISLSLFPSFMYPYLYVYSC